MDLWEFIAKLASNDSIKHEKEKYWRIIVNCFLVDGYEQIQLGTLPNHFKQYYGRAPAYDGKLSNLLQEPEFKAICLTKKINTAIWIQPSSFLLRVMSAQLNPPDTKEFKKTTNNVNNNNNTNEFKAMQNPFAILAQKEAEGLDQGDEARFGRVTLEELNCGICFELLKEAVEGSCCKNLFCLPCIERNGRKCPNCRKLVEWAANEPIRRLIAKKPVLCEYEECKAWSTIGEIDQHRIKCEYRPENAVTACQNCQRQMSRYLIEEHISNICELTKIPCRNCGFMILRKDVPKHEEEVCELRRVLCPHLCGNHMTFKELQENHYGKCDYAPVKCTNYKCQLQVQKRLLQMHLQTCAFSKIICPNSVRGCKAQFTMANKAFSQKHAQECRFKIVRCPYGCNQEMLKHKLKTHECDYMPEECDLCGKEFRSMDLASHRSVCPSRLVTCPNRCNEEVTATDFNKHIETLCPQRQVRCRACKQQMTLASTTAHWTHDCPKRMASCTKCNERVTFDALQNHVSNQCPKRIIRCTWCEYTACPDAFQEHKKICHKRPVKCECGAEVPFKDYANHQARCLWVKVACGLCGEAVPGHRLHAHRTEQCPQRQVSCPSCRKSVVAAKFHIHTREQCLERKVRCPKCYAKMTYTAYVLQHGACPAAFRSCPHCSNSISNLDYDFHVDNCKKKDQKGDTSCIVS